MKLELPFLIKLIPDGQEKVKYKTPTTDKKKFHARDLSALMIKNNIFIFFFNIFTLHPHLMVYQRILCATEYLFANGLKEY